VEIWKEGKGMETILPRHKNKEVQDLDRNEENEHPDPEYLLSSMQRN
jgi:hypothetical protein